MNENSQPPMPAIKDWLLDASQRLSSIGITSAHLDAEIILAHTLRKNRTYLHGHVDDILTTYDQEVADARLALRLDRVPIAYIIGHKEFYGRRFTVTTATLIPRPESEDIVDVIKKLVPKNLSLLDDGYRLVDVGTGTGCLGITAKLELPDIDVTLLDISPYALKVAASNASRLNADVRSMKSDLLAQYPFKADMIVANLPYVDPSWDRSPETNHEPDLALFADDGGKALMIKLISQAPQSLRAHGYLLLEADPTQHAALIDFAHGHGFHLKKKLGYCLALQKTT